MTCYVLDTDHLSLYERGHPQLCKRMLQVRQQSSDIFATTVITIEEQYAGRLAQIRKATHSKALIQAYNRLQSTFQLFSDLDVLAYNLQADTFFQNFRQAGIRIGTQDLRIASVTLAHKAILLTRNLRDFEKVPGVIIQDWSISGNG